MTDVSPEAVLADSGTTMHSYEPVRSPPADPGRGKPFGRLRLLSVDDVLAAPPRSYFLPGLMAPRELSVWWGAPKCGKSFLLLRLSYGLACGHGMWGREPSRPVRCLYIAAEGEGGLGNRLRALLAELGHPGDAFGTIAQRVTLGPPAEDVDAAIAAARSMRAEVVVVDTLARTFGQGNEDAAQDMGAFIQCMDRLREEAGCHVAIVHHAPKDESARTPRGSGALLGAADLVVRIRKGVDGGPGTATVEHAKDEADGTVLPFRLRVVDVAAPAGGPPQQTCIATQAEARAGTNGRRLSKQAQRALEMLADLIGTQGNNLPAGPMFPQHPDLRCVGWEDWRAACKARSLTASKEKRTQNYAFTRSAAILLDAKRIATAEHNGAKLVWLTGRAGT